jgi:protein tyrosine/serine phosphatase
VILDFATDRPTLPVLQALQALKKLSLDKQQLLHDGDDWAVEWTGNDAIALNSSEYMVTAFSSPASHEANQSWVM